LPPASFRFDGIKVDALSLAEAASRICDEVSSGTSFSVFTLNLDHVVKLRGDPQFRAAYERARVVLPDGFPIAVAGRLRGTSVSRAAGSDLIVPLCAEASRRQLGVVLLGSTWCSLSKAADRLHANDPQLQIAGVYAPPARFDVLSEEALEAIAFVRNSGAKICLLALGAPKQELFADRCASLVDGVAFVCVGAGLDFIAGQQRRAPRLLRKLGLEWMWRMLLDPRRLALRYILCLRVLPSVLFESRA
jgi:N-acetylglucosaminyldiphosphoundecaprenol N-acetyl-beta-D-mannosaminyltransferase